MLNRRTFTTGVAAVALAGVTDAQVVDDDNAIRAILRRRIDVEKRTVGMAVCVVTPGRERFVTWGHERVEDARPVTSATVFEIGSITKIFTALLLADMVRRGQMAFDDPVTHHLPGDFQVPAVHDRQITLADLATHTSGLPIWPPFSLPNRPPFDSAMVSALFQAISRYSLEDFRNWLAHYVPPRPAGAGWDYSNAGYALLGLALAHRGGQAFETLLQSHVIERMGLRETTAHPTGALVSRLAESHEADLKPIPPMVNLGIFAPAGCLRSTPRDLSRFAAAILPGSGASISADERLLFTVRRPAAPIHGMQALGWEVLDSPGGTFVSKDGVTSGQAASIVFDPGRRLAIVVFSNTFPDLHFASLSGGGVGSADVARHLLRPQIPLSGDGGAMY